MPLMPLMPLSPSLTASAVSPGLTAVVPPVLNHPVVAVQNPLSLTPLTPSVHAAPSKGDDVRADVSKAVGEWRAARALPVASAKSSPETPESSSLPLDAFFDGSLPTSNSVLSRASSLGLHDAALALAISESASPSDAAARLSALGVLASKESVLSASRDDEFRFLLTRIWRKTSPSIPSPFAVDAGFGVPALKVVKDGVTYFVHAVAHGRLGPPRRGAVLSMVRGLEKSGAALYSEQNLPAYFGYKAGFETLDHAFPVRVVPAAPGFTSGTLRVKRAIDWAISPGSFLASVAWAIAVPTSIFAWALVPLLGAAAFLILTGGLPLMSWKRSRLAAAARADGLEDIAEQYVDEARNFFTAKPDLEALRGLELPQPLGATGDALSARSRAIADAVAASAAASGAAAVHLIVGHLHAHEVAYRLAEGPRPPAAGSQIS
jgi:hypothetical protein